MRPFRVIKTYSDPSYIFSKGSGPQLSVISAPGATYDDYTEGQINNSVGPTQVTVIPLTDVLQLTIS